MKKKVISILLSTMLLLSYGCAALLEGDTSSERRHVAATNERSQEERLEVSGYEELLTVMLGLVQEHETSGMMRIRTYEGNDQKVQEDVNHAIYEIMNDIPTGVYAVADIAATVTRILTYFEVDINIEYKHTKEQVESIVAVASLRSLRNELQRILSGYREEAVFLTSLFVTKDEMLQYVKETYYQNPRSIIMMPLTVAEIYPAGSDERYIELSFGYLESMKGYQQQYSDSLAGSVRRNANAAEGENDAEILLCLVENLIGACSYDEGIARTISEHGVQNLAATAYNALVFGSAVGEGFAMAFKALCDELEFDCRVVLGSQNGTIHAWNIVSLYGDYYHIDVAMCAQNGVETAFLKSDADFAGSHSWDNDNTVPCNGALTYEDIVPPEEIEEIEEIEGEGNEEAEAGEDVDGETGEETGAETSEELLSVN